MALNVTQEEGDLTSGNIYCASVPASPVGTRYWTAAAGATAGSTERTATAIGDGQYLWLKFRCDFADGTTTASGNWTWRFNVTSGVMFCTMDEVYICHVRGTTVQSTLGSATGLTEDLSTTGVHSGTISCSAPSGWQDGDFVWICFVVTNTNMNGQAVGITPDQDIDTPFTAPVESGLAQEFTFGQTQPVIEATEVVGY